MAETILLPLQAGTLPVGFCPTTEQARLNGYAQALKAVLDGESFYNYGASVPAPENRSYPWFNTDTGLWYWFSGTWLAARPVCEQDLSYRILWAGEEADVPTKDGGTAGTAGLTSGPFWEIDTAFAGRSPMAPGAITESNPSKTLAVNENYGAGAHAQTAEELYPHTHTPDPTQADGFLGHAVTGAPASYNVGGGGDTINMGQTASAGGNTDSEAEPMPVVHPVRGIWVLKPTVRKWYSIPG